MSGEALGAGAGWSTMAVHAGSPRGEAGDPVVLPVFQTSTFANHPDGGAILYSRYGNNPNHAALEARIAALEGSEACLVTGSGMAAMAMAILSATAAGGRILASDALYGGTRVLLDRELSRLELHARYVDFAGDGWRAAIGEGADVVILEIPTNPLVRVVDIPAIAAAARASGAAVIVDATFATPVNIRPLEHGADLVVHSATKYFGGHSDVTAGAVCGTAERIDAVRARAQLFGTAPDPHAAWLVERGIKTLALRMERHNRNGLEIARWCEEHPGIRRVHYPGLPSHPDHALATRLLRGYGGMLGIELAGGGDAASRFMHRLRMVRVAPSLGGVETLASEPRRTSHAAAAPEERARLGIPDGFVRISVGIEDAADIMADLDQALDPG